MLLLLLLYSFESKIIVYKGIYKTSITCSLFSSFQISFGVEAVDQGGQDPRTGSAIVKINILDVNDNAPYFPSILEFEVAEKQEPGTSVGQLKAYDDDIGINAELAFSQHDITPSRDNTVSRYSTIKRKMI